MPYSFKIVGQFSDLIMEQERRAVYTTPKSFLELIKLFKVMQAKKEGDLHLHLGKQVHDSESDLNHLKSDLNLLSSP